MVDKGSSFNTDILSNDIYRNIWIYSWFFPWQFTGYAFDQVIWLWNVYLVMGNFVDYSFMSVLLLVQQEWEERHIYINKKRDKTGPGYTPGFRKASAY